MRRHQEAETKQSLLLYGQQIAPGKNHQTTSGFKGLPPLSVAAPKAPLEPKAFPHKQWQAPVVANYTNYAPSVSQTNDLNISTLEDRFELDNCVKMTSRPPSYNIAHHVYDIVMEPQGKHKYLCIWGLVNLLLGLLVFSVGLSSALVVNDQFSLRFYSPLYQSCWTSPFYISNGVLGIISAKRATRNWFVAHLIFSVLCIVCSIILVILCVLDWSAAGFARAEVSCIIFRYDHNKFKVLNRSNDIGFAECVQSFKLASTFLIIVINAAIVLGVVNLTSLVMCILRTVSSKRMYAASRR